MAHHDSTDLETSYSRRRLLQAGGMVSAVLVAGCTGDDREPADAETGTPTSNNSDNEGQAEDGQSGSESTGDDPSENDERTVDVPDVDGLWPMYQRDPANTGHGQGLTGPRNEVKKLWEFETDDRILSSPVVKDGTVYIGSNDGHIYALDASEGSEKWKFSVRKEVIASPCVVDDSVFIGDMAGFIYAIDTSTGEESWQFETARGEVWGELSTDGTRVYGISGASGDPDITVHAISTDDGVQLWNNEKLEDFKEADMSGPRFGANIANPDRIRPTIAVHSGNVLVSTSGGYNYFDIGVGSLEGGVYVGDSPLGLAVINNYIYSLNENGQLKKQRLDDESGVWNFDLETLGRTSPAIGVNNVFCGADDNRIYAVDRQEGIKRWSFETGASVQSSPAVTGEAVYVGSNDGTVYALRPDNGQEIWSYDIGRPIISSPAIGDEMIYVGSRDGSVYALS